LEWQQTYELKSGLAEDLVWTKDIEPIVGSFPENVVDLWHYCFTEMFNNALDHSGGTRIIFHVTKTAANTQMYLGDDGVGIFKKIQSALNLADERHAILELSKGKLTTSPEKHTGQGIFFTSRLLDSFDILSGGVYYSHELGNEEDWIVERAQPGPGTGIFMKLNNHTARTCKKIFDQYSDKEDLGFVKTVVPVRLAQYGNDKLISRSQAKRVVARLDLGHAPTLGIHVRVFDLRVGLAQSGGRLFVARAERHDLSGAGHGAWPLSQGRARVPG